MSNTTLRPLALGFLFLLVIPVVTVAQTKSRARELRLPIGGTPGPLDAITDVAGVEVGHTTLISGSGPLVVGKVLYARVSRWSFRAARQTMIRCSAPGSR